MVTDKRRLASDCQGMAISSGRPYKENRRPVSVGGPPDGRGGGGLSELTVPLETNA